jgi:hypothetical protein
MIMEVGELAKRSTTWRDVRKAQRDLLARFPHDAFLRTVLSGCIRVARDKDNPIRGNLVAAGLREAVGHVLHGLSPDAQVRNCCWFVQATDTKTVTRNQRASFIIKAGLPDDFVRDILRIDVKAYAADLIEMMNRLNASTHVRPDTILVKAGRIREMMMDVSSGLLALLDAADESRREVTRAVGAAMQDAVFMNLISESIGELDELSTHTSVDGHEIDTIEVTRLDALVIAYRVTGIVEVDLQYGSGSDMANDIGFRSDDSYPYEATVTGSASDPMTLDADDVQINVDTRSFYE